MKKNKIFIVLAVLGVMFSTACTDLEREIYSNVQIDEYYQTPEQFTTLIANAYSQLAGEHGYVYREGYWSMQEYTSDEVVVPTRGTHWFDNGVPIKMHTHTWEADTRDINNGWSFAYGGSSKCNDILSKIKSIKGEDESEYDEVTIAGIAETKVLRAFYHLLAMDLYGNVAIDDGEREVKQYTRKEVFEWIENEIKDNLNNLDNSVRYGSMTQSVAHTILAKLYMNSEVYTGTARWEDAIEQLDAVINGGYGYQINDDYFKAFKKDNTFDPEIIFPIVFDAVYAKGNMFHLMTMHYTMQEVYGFTTETWNGPCTLKSFYDKYDDSDLRKKQWFTGPIMKDDKLLTYTVTVKKDPDNKDEEGEPVKLDAIITPEVTTLQEPNQLNTFEGARFFKFEVEPGIEHHANSDFPIYRYADILLMKAEALLRKDGSLGSFLNDAEFQKMRTRAGLAPYTALTLDELLDERGRELAWEGHRRQDLIRFGKFTTGMWEFMGTRSKNREIFPIPQWVLDANPGVYTQNNWQ